MMFMTLEGNAQQVVARNVERNEVSLDAYRGAESDREETFSRYFYMILLRPFELFPVVSETLVHSFVHPFTVCSKRLSSVVPRGAA